MTVVITRYFDSAAQARSVKHELVHWRRFSLKILDLFESPRGLAAALQADHVEPETIRAYEERLANGGAVLLVRAGYKPLGVAQITRDVAAEMGAADMGDLVEEVYVKDEVRTATLSLLEDHPLLLSRPRDHKKTAYYMADWPIALISRRKPLQGSVMTSHPHFTKEFFPLLDERKPYTGSIIKPHAHMANFPIPLISRRKPSTASIIPRHAHMANFPIPLISRRRPSGRSIFPRHQRMATVPFPLLINEETGKNALIPGQPHMANFPIPLISKRKPSTASIFPRHAHMANFPIPLISRRKPSTASIIPRHGHMAEFPWPLVIRRSNTAAPDGGSGFSFSKMLGMRTITRK
ncbi:PucR family transcriptional regulator [Ovoidimarina sediminis]|uniref:PucR family transcriptional regulator n=1 Tax=Ovoidimarina sediminis TaxID=3079856 RepID=UPI00290FFA0B|nr:PucR family transcriptional regulator [Rhodophyticola sp. MJ-SS7]MDU8945560.1 PucR family transcriptional regulator [Rhodophyticola sp. MJ-SS7]